MKTERIEAVLLGIIVLVLLGAVLKLASSIMLPLFIAGLLAVTVSPLINLLNRLHIPRNLAVLIVIGVLFGVIALIALFIQTSVSAFIAEYPKYAVRFTALNDSFIQFLADKLGVSFDLFGQINWFDTLLKYLGALSSSIVGYASSGLLIMIFLIFMLLENPLAPRKLILAFNSETTGNRINNLLEKITGQVVIYLNLKFVISAGTGLLVWISLMLIGLDFAPMWGVFAFLLNFIPSIGSAILMVITILMGFIQFFPEPGRIIAVIISMVGIQAVIGNFIDPRMQANRLNVSPIVLLISLVFWGWIWGIVGMFLAVPLTVIIQIICENIPFLYPISILMGSGRKIEHIEVDSNLKPKKKTKEKIKRRK